MHILIVGAGDVGFQLAKRLAREQHDITLVDMDGAKVRRAREQIALEKEDAIRQIRREVAVLSVDISEKVLRKNLDKKNEQMSMIDRLLNEINMG